MDSLDEIRKQRASAWAAKNPKASETSRSRSRSPRVIPKPSEVTPLRVLTWNIDGLDNHSDEIDILGRTLWVIDQIATLCPHVVFLQELIEYNYSILFQKLGSAYHFIKQENCAQPYFVAILIHKRTMEYHSPGRIPFPTSKMGRSAVYLKARLQGTTEWIGFITAHLESLAESSVERKSQLNLCLDHATGPTLFGGDLNIRDTEVPSHLTDCWVLAGSNKEHQYTWDMSRNDNPKMTGKPRCRFDRLYALNFEPLITKFELVGTERVVGLGRFASDHFGIFLEIAIKL